MNSFAEVCGQTHLRDNPELDLIEMAKEYVQIACDAVELLTPKHQIDQLILKNLIYRTGGSNQQSSIFDHPACLVIFLNNHECFYYQDSFEEIFVIITTSQLKLWVPLAKKQAEPSKVVENCSHVDACL